MFFSTNPKNGWFQNLVVLAILMLFVLWFKRHDLSPYYEGFVQDAPYVYKQDADIYDDFYTEIYDKLMNTEKLCTNKIDKIIDSTHPCKKNSSFLSIGSKTGFLSGKIADKGYMVYAVDSSKAMVEYTSNKYPDVHVKQGDVRDSVLYEKGSFSHILSMDLGIYQFKNKDTFFRNSYFWLKPGGDLVIHLVNREKFDTIVPGGKPPLLDNPQQYSAKRITDTIIDFIDFTYKGSYDFSDTKNNKVTFKETFTDGLTKNVRQNDLTLYMEPIDQILQLASDAGFILHKKESLGDCSGDENQFLYVLERPN